MIYHGIQEATPEGGFIRKNDKGEWCRVPSHVAREKVGQGFRDLLHTEYRSSTKAKIKRRRDRLYPPIKPTEGEEVGKGRSEATRSSSAGEHIDAKNAPALGNRKISKSFSYDSEPIPIQVDQQNGVTLLSQCSLSFVAEDKSHDVREHDRRGVVPTQKGEGRNRHHDSNPPILKGQQSLSHLSSCALSAAVTPKRSGSAHSQVEDHRTWPGEPVQAPYPYYQQYSSHPTYSYDSRDGGYDSYCYGAARAGSWGERAFMPPPQEEERQRNRVYYPRWY